MAPDFSQALGVAGPDTPAPPNAPGTPGVPGAPQFPMGGPPAACDCSCETYVRMQDFGARADTPGFSPTPEENALMICGFQCMSQFAACVR